MEEIETEVRDGKLIIKGEDNGWFSWSDKNNDELQVYITMKNIEGLSVSGSGKIRGENKFQTNTMGISVIGSGNVEIATDSKALEFSISGSGSVIISGTAVNVETSISGSGKVNAGAKGTLSM